MEDLEKLNHNVDTKSIQEGITIMLPANSLSSRDKEIIGGIGKFSYRTYPVRKGETVQDIASKRGISMAEMEKLNPDVNLSKVQGT